MACIATGLLARIEDHEELVGSLLVVVRYDGDTITAVVCRESLAVRAVVRTLAHLPSWLDHAVGANDSVLFIEKEVVLF